MNKTVAQQQARALLAAHGLDPDLFKWNRGKNLMGQMSATRNRYTGEVTLLSVSLSSYWVEAMTADEVREVMLHEVAHALLPTEGHNWTFKAKVRELGGIARDTCFSPSAETNARMEALAPAAWVGTCPNCGTERKMHRAPTAVRACSKCCRGKFNMAFVFYYKHNGRLVPPSAMPAKYARAYSSASIRHASQNIMASLNR
jgi:predicted SprT family Zn-dependent metalloprotease